MPVTVYLPAYLQPFAEGRSEVEMTDAGPTVADALRALGRRYPGVYDRVITERGEVRPHVNVFLDARSIREREGLASRLSERSELLIIAAVSGG